LAYGKLSRNLANLSLAVRQQRDNGVFDPGPERAAIFSFLRERLLAIGAQKLVEMEVRADHGCVLDAARKRNVIGVCAEFDTVTKK
jgi:hypothetical protein